MNYNNGEKIKKFFKLNPFITFIYGIAGITLGFLIIMQLRNEKYTEHLSRIIIIYLVLISCIVIGVYFLVFLLPKNIKITKHGVWDAWLFWKKEIQWETIKTIQVYFWKNKRKHNIIRNFNQAAIILQTDLSKPITLSPRSLIFGRLKGNGWYAIRYQKQIIKEIKKYTNYKIKYNYN